MSKHFESRERVGKSCSGSQQEVPETERVSLRLGDYLSAPTYR